MGEKLINFQARITVKMYDRIKHKAIDSHINIQELIRNIFEDYFKKK